MMARICFWLYMCFQLGVIFCLMTGLLFLSLTCLFVYGFIAWGISLSPGYIIAVVVLALMSIFSLGVPISSIRMSKLVCDALEQRGLMKDAVRQLRAHPHWGENYILTQDYYFARGAAYVICLKDIVQIELNRTNEYNEDQGNVERIELRLTTRQGEILCPSSTGPRWEKELLQRQFKTLQARYPDKAVESVLQKK